MYALESRRGIGGVDEEKGLPSGLALYCGRVCEGILGTGGGAWGTTFSFRAAEDFERKILDMLFFHDSLGFELFEVDWAESTDVSPICSVGVNSVDVVVGEPYPKPDVLVVGGVARASNWTSITRHLTTAYILTDSSARLTATLSSPLLPFPRNLEKLFFPLTVLSCSDADAVAVLVDETLRPHPQPPSSLGDDGSGSGGGEAARITDAMVPLLLLPLTVTFLRPKVLEEARLTERSVSSSSSSQIPSRA